MSVLFQAIRLWHTCVGVLASAIVFCAFGLCFTLDTFKSNSAGTNHVPAVEAPHSIGELEPEVVEVVCGISKTMPESHEELLTFIEAT